MSALPTSSKTSGDYDSDRNSIEGYALALKAARERCIRSGQILPRIGDEREQRWAAEGPRDPSELEAVRG